MGGPSLQLHRLVSFESCDVDEPDQGLDADRRANAEAIHAMARRRLKPLDKQGSGGGARRGCVTSFGKGRFALREQG